jgi:mono/diheme cytochrome c family protein
MPTMFSKAVVSGTLALVVALIATGTAETGTVQQRPTPAQPAQPAPPKPPLVSETPSPARIEAGTKLFKKNGCYECHGQEAQGGANGARIGPNPIPFPRFLAYVRNPAADMPPYTAKVISDDDLASIYAFLQARPQPKPVNAIPLLAP